MKKLFALLLTVSLSISITAQDTFSICAIDTITGEVGSAGASCIYIAGQGVMILSDVHPGVGVIHSQAWYLPANQAYARSLMNLGLAPQQIIDSLVAHDAQNNPTLRQYGIVDFRDGIVRTAGYTGINTDDYKNHIIGPNYTIQGNILLGQQILDSMEARFLNAEGELVCRLMEALQGANVAGADIRCLSAGTSSIGGFLRVAKPDDDKYDLYFQINLPSVDAGVDPIDSLQSLVDMWGGCNNTGIGDNKTYYQIKVHPNPSGKIVNFTLPSGIKGSECEILIYDTYGKLITKIDELINGRAQLIVSSYPPGIYYFQLLQSGNIKSKGKFIVE